MFWNKIRKLTFYSSATCYLPRTMLQADSSCLSLFSTVSYLRENSQLFSNSVEIIVKYSWSFPLSHILPLYKKQWKQVSYRHLFMHSFSTFKDFFVRFLCVSFPKLKFPSDYFERIHIKNECAWEGMFTDLCFHFWDQPGRSFSRKQTRCETWRKAAKSQLFH